MTDPDDLVAEILSEDPVERALRKGDAVATHRETWEALRDLAARLAAAEAEIIKAYNQAQANAERGDGLVSVTGDRSRWCCASLHVKDHQVRHTVEAEKARGYWKNATVDEAVRSTFEARRAGPCPCSHHQAEPSR